jgi:hypothetical protein
MVKANICKTKNCKNVAIAKGLCRSCYKKKMYFIPTKKDLIYLINHLNTSVEACEGLDLFHYVEFDERAELILKRVIK